MRRFFYLALMTYLSDGFAPGSIGASTPNITWATEVVQDYAKHKFRFHIKKKYSAIEVYRMPAAKL